MNTHTLTKVVADTNAVISYFSEIFGTEQSLSGRGRNCFEGAFGYGDCGIRMVIPSVVFLEIYDKWMSDEESAARINSQIFRLAESKEYIEIRPLDREVLEATAKLSVLLDGHEVNDIIIFATAVVLGWPLVSSDSVLRTFNQATGLIPDVL
jgi:predicted nucleic acid-binding protein